MTDPNANPPLGNRPETVYGTTISFLCLAWIGIFLRFYVRYTQRTWWWDDVFVLLSGAAATSGSVLVCLMPNAGMGKHFYTLDNAHITTYFKYVWATNATYTSSTALIKLAILLQYTRLFDFQTRVARRLTWSLIIIVALWGITAFFLAIFACVPIAKNWDFDLSGKCVAWGSKNPDVLLASYTTHSGSNVLLDFLVLFLPVPFLTSLRKSGRRLIGLVGLFFIGGICGIISIIRLLVLAITKAGTQPTFDPTWAVSSVYIFSVLEINIAILCASIPTFWPLIEVLTGNKILVVQEIEIRTDRRDSTFAEQQYIGFPEDTKGRTSRMSTVIGVGRRSSYSPTRHTHRHKKSNGSSLAGIELGRRISQESDRGLAYKLSSTTLSSIPSGDSSPKDTLGRTPSLDSKHDYLEDWGVPEFERQDGGEGLGHHADVRHEEMPSSFLKAPEK